MHDKDLRKIINIVIKSTRHEDTKKNDCKLDHVDDEYMKRIMDIFKKETRAAKKTRLDRDEIKKDDNQDHEVRKRNEHGKLRVRGKGDYPEDISSSESSDDNDNNYGGKYDTPKAHGKKNIKNKSEDKEEKEEKKGGEEKREEKKGDTPKEGNRDNKDSKEGEEKIISLTSESDDDEERDNPENRDITRKLGIPNNESKIDETIITNLKNQIKNVKGDIYDFKNTIEEELKFDLAKSKDSNHKYEKREHMITNVTSSIVS